MAKQPRPPTQPPETHPLAPAPEEKTGLPADLLAALASGHTRALLVTHVPADKETYDKGRKYEVRLLDAHDGKVEVREVVEVADGERTLGMPFHVALSHLERHFADFLKPGQFR